jgi:Lrp/AsnC family transcriptional regulator, regulator for asnA, asnC and gidA
MIDEIDRELIMKLQIDGRIPLADLARDLGVVEGTIRKRIKRLEREKLFKIVGVPDLQALGFNYIAIMGLQIRMPEMEAVGEALREYDEVCYIAYVLGTYDVICMVLAHSREELADFIMHKISKISGIMKTETFSTLKIIKGEATLLDTIALVKNLVVAPPIRKPRSKYCSD